MKFLDSLFEHYTPYSLEKKDYITATLVAIFALITYVFTMTPSVSAGDNGELTTAMFFMGIAHAPGYPLHSFIGKLFTYLPIHNVGWRANFVSAFFGSLTIFFSVILYIKLLLSFNSKKVFALTSAALTGLAYTFSSVLWSQAIMCEVYTLSSVFHPVTILILVFWMDAIIKHKNDIVPYFGERFLLAYAFLFGVAMAGHTTILLTGVFAIFFIFLILTTNVITIRKLNVTQLSNGMIILLFTAVGMAIGWGMYVKNIMHIGTYYLYDPAHVKSGMIGLLVGNIIMALPYLYYRFLAPDAADPENYIQKGYFTIVKMFLIFYLGYMVHLYMFIRSTGNPPINWGGISEVSNVWKKIGKFWNIVWRKQYPDGTLPLNLFNQVSAYKLIIKNIIGSQFSLPWYFVILAGLIQLYKKSKVFLLSTLFMFFSYTILLNYKLKMNLEIRDMFFNSVFFIFAVFTLSIIISFGINFFLEGISNFLSRKNNTNKI